MVNLVSRGGGFISHVTHHSLGCGHNVTELNRRLHLGFGVWSVPRLPHNSVLHRHLHLTVTFHGVCFPASTKCLHINYNEFSDLRCYTEILKCHCKPSSTSLELRLLK